ncbi:MAG TPA: RNA polymerase sigma factor [Candidatus Limnocylindrales bacterium]|nr:RNA polymerase sigma factor [Candidatus Limnocylindrales bacterium]
MRNEDVMPSLAPPQHPRIVRLDKPGRADHNHMVWAYQTHVTAIYQYIYSRVGNRVDAEDLTSQVFVKAINGMRDDVSVAELRSWLYRVAQTTLADHWREYYAEDRTELQDNLASPPPTRENSEAAQRVETLLETLPEQYRRVLELRFLRGYSVREVAQELGLTETNVKVIQFRALNRAGREKRGT